MNVVNALRRSFRRSKRNKSGERVSAASSVSNIADDGPVKQEEAEAAEGDLTRPLLLQFCHP